MIMHVAPRCVAVVSYRSGAPVFQQLGLDTVLRVDLADDKGGDFSLVVDLLSGKQIVAGRYDDPAEAGADFGKLRVLLGLPAWPEEWSGGDHPRLTSGADPAARHDPHAARRAMIALCVVVGVLGCLAAGSIACRKPTGELSMTATPASTTLQRPITAIHMPHI